MPDFMGLFVVASSQFMPGLKAAHKWLVIVVTAAVLAACSGGNGTTTSPSGDIDQSPIQTGVFKDSNVTGLDFVSGARSGVTDARGQFTCTTDQQVTFSIGDVELGGTECATLAHPAALTASGLLSDPRALNITRFLMLLDEDQMPENGIVISDTLRMLANSWAPIDFSASDFDGQVTQVMSDIASVEGRTIIALPSNTDAFTHLDSSLSCAYSGVFVDTVLAGAGSSATRVAVAIYREPGSTTDSFSTEIVRNNSLTQFYLLATGTVELKTLPSLDAGPSSSGAGSIFADFVSPDRLEGGWSGGVGQQSIDYSGAFEANRIGDSFGEYRFTGKFERRTSSFAGQAVIGYVVLTLDGAEISGEAFDLMTGLTTAVTGGRLQESEQVELRLEQSGVESSSVVSLTVDEDGLPVSMDGSWPGLERSTFSASACRL